MARNRIIYQSQALYVGDKTTVTPATKNKELHRVQDISFNVDIARADINEFGQLAQIGREITEPPTVSLDFSYYLHNGKNEANLGFFVNQTESSASSAYAKSDWESALKNIIDTSASVDELNYYVLTKPEGKDAHEASNDSNDGVVAIGNGFVTSMTIEGAVGDYPTASVSVEAANISFGAHGTLDNPAIKESDGSKINTNQIALPTSDNAMGSGEDLEGITALRSGDITIEFFGEGKNLSMGGATLPHSGETATPIHVQNFSVELPLSRTPLNKIGNFFPFSREIDFPITGSFSLSANVGDFQDGELHDIICGQDKQNCVLTFKNKCSTTLGDGDVVYQILIKGATLDSQNFSHGIGDQQSVDLTFSVPLGANQSSGDGIFLAGEWHVDSTPNTPSASASASASAS